MSKNFQGFSKATIKFFNNLKANNNKTWFENHRKEYEADILNPMRALVSDLSGHMLKIDSLFEVTPAIDKTISRIYRDTRFTKDKSPYKSTMWISFKRPDKNWKDSPVYFFEIASEWYRYGMGFYNASPVTMKQLRDSIDEDQKSFKKAISFYKKHSHFELEGEMYKKIFDKEKSPEIMEWYQRRNLYLISTHNVDSQLFGDTFIDKIVNDFNLLEPLYRYLWKIRS